MPKWREEFLNQAQPKDPDTFPFVLMGNKIDAEADRKVRRAARCAAATRCTQALAAEGRPTPRRLRRWTERTRSSGARSTAASSTSRCARRRRLAAGACVVAHRADDCLQVSAKDATNVDPAFGHVALAAFEHFKEIKALQEQELMKGAASARIDLGAADDQPAGQESTCC